MADSEYLRCFLAIPITGSARSELANVIARWQSALGDQIRWMPTDQLHLTVRFIGNLSSLELLQICSRLREIEPKLEPLTIELASFGTFPDSGPPRVVWAGINDLHGELASLHTLLDQELEQLGFRGERREYHPHITLGRARNHCDANALNKAFADSQLTQSITPETVGLYASQKATFSVHYDLLDQLHL
ncbi:MAG TPA: RNA 2',3'-cyclic phosphodiesterase [Planctomycetaceae bacterium]|nr:RNA 2',3'-cyclic phosphodiesterase [Planctomycetaceae bacterium]